MRALLLSGGVDSAAIACLFKPDVAITVDYGQRPAKGEIRAASAVANHLRIEHHVVTIDASALGGGSLVGSRPINETMPPEWWPLRNQFLATVAAMKLSMTAGGEILIGSVQGDAVHCDGRPEFVDAMDQVLRVQKPGFRFRAPAIQLTAIDLLIKSSAPLGLLGWTFSCHTSDVACGECRGCRKHIELMGRYREHLTRSSVSI